MSCSVVCVSSSPAQRLDQFGHFFSRTADREGEFSLIYGFLPCVLSKLVSKRDN